MNVYCNDIVNESYKYSNIDVLFEEVTIMNNMLGYSSITENSVLLEGVVGNIFAKIKELIQKILDFIKGLFGRSKKVEAISKAKEEKANDLNKALEQLKDVSEISDSAKQKLDVLKEKIMNDDVYKIDLDNMIKDCDTDQLTRGIKSYELISINPDKPGKDSIYQWDMFSKAFKPIYDSYPEIVGNYLFCNCGKYLNIDIKETQLNDIVESYKKEQPISKGNLNGNDVQVIYALKDIVADHNYDKSQKSINEELDTFQRYMNSLESTSMGNDIIADLYSCSKKKEDKEYGTRVKFYVESLNALIQLCQKGVQLLNAVLSSIGNRLAHSQSHIAALTTIVNGILTYDKKK